jgi:hypothetical protein
LRHEGIPLMNKLTQSLVPTTHFTNTKMGVYLSFLKNSRAIKPEEK